ncbi:uncharacterized protein [Apostichopus japonicus]|uniref:uncharacterized protein n=1 Tax=Stichopus japonicus TaxID=307972 RepID=UPI003AB1A674
MSESENKSQPCGSSEDPEMSESENKSQPCGSSEVDPRQKSVSDKKDSISNAVPLCLPNNYTWDSDTNKISVDKTNPRKTLTVCTEGLELLQRLGDQLVVVLCIAGPARSGKSFFASQLLEDVNFDVGHGAGSHTAGIWIGVGEKPVSFRSGKARVVILDAEGLGGVNTDSSNTDAKWEHKIFSLCVLLSSYVIYNSKGSPNNDELDKLGFIAEFSRSIFRERQKDVHKLQTPSEGLGQFGPDFLWLFRDNLYTPDLNGKPCDWTEFVKKALLDPKPNETERNHIRKSITSTFRTIQAADLPPPTTDSRAVKKLLAVVNKDKISQDFFPRIKEVVQNMLSSVQVKTIKGSKLTGSLLIDMLLHVVDIVNSECDKLDVTSMWDSIVNAEMQRYIQSALDLYKEKMEQVELPENEKTYLKLHKSAKDFSKAHFVKVTKRFDEDICSSQLKVLCDKIKTEFDNTLMKKNDQASLSFNKELILALENEYFNKLPAKSSCMKLKTADKNINDCFNERAKGSKAVKRKVKSQAQLLRDQKIGSMRTESLIYAEQQSCELFEMSLKKALEGESLIQSELNALKETFIKDCFNNFSKVKCNDEDCTPCMKSGHSLGQKVESIFKSCSSECYYKSDKACQCLIKKLIQIKLLPFVMNIDSHNYSDFLKLKEEILTQYDREAKGPAKRDLLGTCTETIDMHQEGIQLLIIQSALKNVSCKYTNILNKTANSDPCGDEKLKKLQALKRKDMVSAFNMKCLGIDKSKLRPYQLNLVDVIKNFTVWITNENTLRSINLCEELVTRLSKEFHDGILQTHFPETHCETEYSQCSYNLQKVDKLKDKIRDDYKQKARGPEKERFQKSLNKYIEILLTAMQHHFYQLDTIKQKFPISETELQSAISETTKNTEKEFTDTEKQISLPLGSCSKDILSIVLNFDTIHLVEEKYKESMEQLDSICKRFSLASRKKCEELVGGGQADTVKLAQIRDGCIEDFEKTAQGVLKDHYKSILQGNVDLEIRIAHTTLVDDTVKRIFAVCRTSIENLVQSNPRERDDLVKEIEKVKENVRMKIQTFRNKVAEANMTGTEEMIAIELKDTISYVGDKNLRISSEKCYAQLREVMKALTSRCKRFLDNEKSTVEALCHIKTECLGEFEKGAIGPAKETVKEALEKEIDKEIQRTYALFAKTSYRETILVKTEAFQYEDQVNSSGEVNLDELTKHLEKESQDILLRYPGLFDKIKNDLSDDLRKEREFYLKVLKQKITLTSDIANYRSSIEALIKDGPCEEEHLNKHIDMIKKEAWESIEMTFKEVEQTNFALTKGMLKKALKDTTLNTKAQNHILSTAKCSSVVLQVSEELKGYCKNFLESEKSVIDNLRHLKFVYLRKYDEVAIGPAKAKERKTLEKEIVEEVDRTFVLFAKSKYRKTLLVKTEAFQYEDQVFASIKVNLDDLTKHLEKESKNILLKYPELVDKLKNDLSKDLRKECEFYLKVLKQKITLTSDIANYRSSIEALIKDGPCEEEHLNKHIDMIKKEAWESIEMTFKEVEQTNFALAKGMLKKALKDTTLNTKAQNHILSTAKCSSVVLQVSEELKGYCKNFLESEKSVIDNLRHLKFVYLRKYDEVAIGPAKAKERKTLEKEIVEEVDRTFVLFAKSKYRKTLLVKTEAFQYEDQVFASIKVNLDDLTKHLEKESKNILLKYPELVDKLKNDLSKDLRKECEFYLKVLKQKITLTLEVTNYGSSIEALLKDGPCEEEHLKKQIDKKRKEAWECIKKTFKEVEQTNFALTEGMLEKALDNTTRNIETQNHFLSTTKCSSLLLQVSEELKRYCKNLSETSEIDNLRHLKDEYLRKYDEFAIGPAKAKERKTLEKEIVEEVDRTFVLFAKAKYRIILREEIQTFQFLDLLNNPEPERIEQLVQLLMTKVDDIQNTYPTLGDSTRDNLTRDLEESINPSLLNEIITAYGKKISQLGYQGILEEDELENEIESAKNGLFEILRPRIIGINGGLPEESQNIIEDLETSFKQGNVERSRINCQKTLDLLFQYKWDYLTKVHFRKNYDNKCKGPARQMVWNDNQEIIDLYYDSNIALWRKVSSPLKYFLYTEV